ncbi:MAG: glycosyltransferase family 2 protein [Pseudomonadota bacterium]
MKRDAAPLRIILKTRNEPFFLRDWFRHHAAIVGPEHLIIADNMSDDPDVLSLLAELSHRAHVFQFDAFHDDLHKRELFQPFYSALEDTCDWSMLLDTDERLTWMDRSGWIADHRLVDRVMQRTTDAHALPGLLVENQPGSRDHLRFPQKTDRLASVLHWGKPALASSHGRKLTGAQCHNIQFPSEMFSADVPPCLVAVHLCNLDPQQRMRANREKLAARGVCGWDTPFIEIARIDVSTEQRSVIRRCVLEIDRLLKAAPIKPDSRGAVVMRADGTLGFSSSAAEQAFEYVQSNGAEMLRAASR